MLPFYISKSSALLVVTEWGLLRNLYQPFAMLFHVDLFQTLGEICPNFCNINGNFSLPFCAVNYLLKHNSKSINMWSTCMPQLIVSCFSNLFINRILCESKNKCSLTLCLILLHYRIFLVNLHFQSSLHCYSIHFIYLILHVLFGFAM